MPITLDLIAGLLDKIGLKYRQNPEREAIEISWKLERYRNHEGDGAILVILELSSGGRTITARAPMLYTLPEGPTALSACKALFIASRGIEFLKFAADPEDNSVEAAGAFPVADSNVTPQQLRDFLNDFPMAIDFFHPMIRHAIETGEIVEPDPEEPAVDSIVEEIKGLDPESLIQLREALDAHEKELGSSAEPGEL